MIELVLTQCDVKIGDNKETGDKVVIVTDVKSGFRVVMPFTPAAARNIAQALSGSGIIIPAIIPPKDVLKGNGG
jgi:hypothetical protein